MYQSRNQARRFALHAGFEHLHHDARRDIYGRGTIRVTTYWQLDGLQTAWPTLQVEGSATVTRLQLRGPDLREWFASQDI